MALLLYTIRAAGREKRAKYNTDCRCNSNDVEQSLECNEEIWCNPSRDNVSVTNGCKRPDAEEKSSEEISTHTRRRLTGKCTDSAR